MNPTAQPAPDPGSGFGHRATASVLLTFLWLGLLAWGVASELVHSAKPHSGPVGFVLLAVAVVTTTVALVFHQEGSPESSVAVVVMAATGGALVAFAPVAVVFPAVAVLAATIRWPIRNAAGIAAVGWVATVVAVTATGGPVGMVLGCLAAILGGALIGLTRRQALERAEQAARAEVEAARTELERERAELLADRNHLAREMHDVLAHTLAALAVQLEAFGAIVDADPTTSPAVRTQLDQSQRLVREGLDEARRAVRALRDDAPPLDEQLRRLAELHHAQFVTTGAPRPLPAPVVAALYRVAQEALTNVVKHASGAPTTLTLWLAADRVTVVVDNDAETKSNQPDERQPDERQPVERQPGERQPDERQLHELGGGYGILGISERIELLGGIVEAGPTDGGWRVRADVPLSVPAASRTGGGDG